MGDYALSASFPAGLSGYGPGVTGATFPRQLFSSLTSSNAWGSNVTWNSSSSRVEFNIPTGNAFARIQSSCTIVSSVGSGSVGISVYKNGSNLTPNYGQFLTASTGISFPLQCQAECNVTNGDNVQVYLISLAGSSNLTTVSNCTLNVQLIGGYGLNRPVSLDTCNPQWFIDERTTTDDATTLSTTEVSVLTYLNTSSNVAPDAITLSGGTFNLLKAGVYNIFACLNFKALTTTSTTITIRLKIGGSTILTRQIFMPTTVNAYFSGNIYYAYVLQTDTSTSVDVTCQSSVANSYLIGSGSTVSIQRIRKFIEFPPSAMSSNSQTISSVTYVASASSTLVDANNLFPYKMFDKVTNSGSSIWANSPQNEYNSTTGVYQSANPKTTSNVDGGSSYNGDWIQLQLSVPTVLSYYTLFPRPDTAVGQMMNTWRLLGSNNGTSWTTLNSQSGVSTWSLGVSKTYTVNSDTAYTYFRIVIQSVNASNSGFASVCEWKLFK